VSSDNDIILSGQVDVISGNLGGPDLTFGGTLTMQLNLGPDEFYVASDGVTQTVYGEVGTGGPGNPAGILNLVFPAGFTPEVGDEFYLFDWGDGVDSSFSEINTPALPAGESWDLNDIYTTGTVSIVPEPTSIALMLGAGGLLLRRRKSA
jgi:hypothetical protein